MSERKVLNKYYPPDFDASKIPRARQSKNRQFTVRLMAPCNMKCTTCGEYIYKGKKFNARKEDVENETYLGIRIYRFYIKCTRCLGEISFKTDPQSTDYIIEAGATRNFMALKLAEEQALREEQAEKEDDATNPMKLLEKRTEASRHEMAILEALEEMKDKNQRQVAPDYETMLQKYEEIRQQDARRQEDEDNAFVESIFGKDGDVVVKRIEDDSEDDDDDDGPPPAKRFAASTSTSSKPTDLLTDEAPSGSAIKEKEKESSVGLLSANRRKLVLVKPKTSAAAVPVPSSNIILASGSNSKASPSAAGSQSSKGTGNAINLSTSSDETKDSNVKKVAGLGLLGAYGSDSSDSASD